MNMPEPSRGLALACLAPLLFAAGLARAADVDDVLADCNDDAPARTLHASAANPAARAHWLDRRHLLWPGQPADGRYRLLHAAAGGLVADSGQAPSGADDAMILTGAGNRLPAALAARFPHLRGDGAVLRVDADDATLQRLLRGELRLVREDATGRVLDATRLQIPGVLDDLYAAAMTAPALGAIPAHDHTSLRVWAPTAQAVHACLYPDGIAASAAAVPLTRDDATGVWSATLDGDRSGQYYRYLVDVFAPGAGLVRNRVTDPYALSLSADSKRGYIADMDADALEPDGWDDAPRPDALAAATDLAVYELHVRDFSRDDPTVPPAHRGRYQAFTGGDSDGMRHLRALAAAGITDIHLLPVFDLATIPEQGCIEPVIPDAAADSEAQQSAVAAVAARDCFNWGYDPFHYTAPEGSYASDAMDGAVRVREFRAMVQALHAAGLRVGMDVVYNHTSASGQDPRSVLDRIVPGYYHRLDADGAVERSTCCDNTATEHRMMERLMIDSAVAWVRHYRIDSFRFDLMGHQPRAAMQRLQAAVNAAAGRHVPLIGEGWNFGEVADGARFVQASQGSLQGSGIGTFSDRARDAIRGGGPADHGDALRAPGYVNGLAEGDDRDALLHAADLVRTGLAGTLRDYRMVAADGSEKPLSTIDYKGQPAGYAAQPGEVVNYVENHDNQTLFDINAIKLPPSTGPEERARVQLLALALNAFSQGIAYFHAGGELLRSKSLDRNSYDSGDWFNRIDWSGHDNHFGTGLPPATDNRDDWPWMRPLLRETGVRPRPDDIAFVRDAFLDLLRIRAGSTMLRLRTAADVRERLRFANTGPAQNPAVIAGHVDGRGYPGARFDAMLYLVNVSASPQQLVLAGEAGKPYRLHPVLRDGTDPRPRQARFDIASGRFELPARTAVVYVLPNEQNGSP
ncbi:alpha-1,6-glucosidase domain-containing protein [Marilutibacter chinensis]|uniref:DUF3372 domain-containing protein n=1 Tax=Marilutibacter chinensis TaxID=2912247 RepID=A0ABS9HWH8_9GAMM|nr:alpha-1,6-glucosidase domain-containing protein [Lysobacter chinensis]MCF7222881.1 DUF3372 domain-containing protein [Lysobacter chinensis]